MRLYRSRVANGLGFSNSPLRLRPDLEVIKTEGVLLQRARAEPPFTREAAGCNPLLGGKCSA